MKQRVIFFTIVASIVLSVVGCKDEADQDMQQMPTPYVIDEQEPEEEETEEVIYPAVEPESLMQIRLRTDLTDEYRDVDLKLGGKVDIPNRQGYKFIGYQDKKDEKGTTYIDENGEYIMEYHGTELLVLWPKFEPYEYCITICEDGRPLVETSKLICKFDENISDDLPWGKEIKKDRKVDNRESYVITGFEVKEAQYEMIDANQKLLFKKLQDYANHDTRTLSLDVITTDTTYLWTNLNCREISNKGFMKQELSNKKEVYDYFSILDNIDLEELIKMGFKSATLNMRVTTQKKDKNNGVPRVIISGSEVDKEKKLKKMALVDTEKIKTIDYKNSYEIPIEQLTGDFYIYYNSEKFGKNSWDCTSITIELEFKK